ncbi:ATP-binding/permease protein CydD [Halioglobus japonicus]|nr:ATP-binding/permease protein CydD [Halioglobus japonicus]
MSSSQRQQANTRIIAPVARYLRTASVLAVVAGLLWPVQAAALAWAISSWVSGATEQAGTAALIFVAAAIFRAALEYRASGYLFDAADITISRERAALIAREARTRASASSAEVAALIAQKLPLLQPWITRYYIAMVRVAIIPFALVALTFWFSWVAGLVLLIAGPLIPVFMALVGMAAEQASRRQMVEIGSMNAMLMERLSAMLDIRLLGAVDRAAGDFSNRAESLREHTMAVLRIAFLSSAVLELFSALGVAMVAVFIGFTLLGAISFGSWGSPLGLAEGLFILLIAPEFFQPFRDLAAAWHDRAEGLAVVAELDALDGADRVSIVGHGNASQAMPGQLSIEIEDATAALPGKYVALPNLRLRAGQSVALTGPSGAGKSTCLAAIAGLVPLSANPILVCGQSLNHANADSWRARIALIPQSPHFPDQTLRDWLDPEALGIDPWPALEQAEASDIVVRLPDGLDTRLGETGGGVSGGEARRLMIARAVLGGRELILADEPTADLDSETAAAITRSLVRLQNDGHTLVVATHDPMLAAEMDRTIGIAQ